MQWDLVDWVAAFALFSFALVGWYFASRGLKKKQYKIAAAALIGIFFLLIWAELAVGILD